MKAVLVLGLLLAFGACAGNGPTEPLPEIPERITKERYLENLHPGGRHMPQWSSAQYRLWRKVRHRADLAEAIMEVVEDRSILRMTRGAAVAYLGGTEQLMVYYYFSHQLLSRATDLMSEHVMALGTCRADVPEIVFETLRVLLVERNEEVQYAAMALRQIGGPEARAILEAYWEGDAEWKDPSVGHYLAHWDAAAQCEL